MSMSLGSYHPAYQTVDDLSAGITSLTQERSHLVRGIGLSLLSGVSIQISVMDTPQCQLEKEFIC